jgi:hypothetical protein
MWNDQDRFKGYDKRKDITMVKEVKAQRQVWAMRKKMRDHKYGYNNPFKESRLEINEFIDIVDEFKNKVVNNV